MILSQTLKIRINSKTLNYYKAKGYECNKVGEEIEISYLDLKPYSREILTLECDYCGKVYEKKFCDWRKGQQIVKKDCCEECKGRKMRDISLKLYNCENVFQNEEIKNKSQKTILNKFGVINVSCSPEIQFIKLSRRAEKIKADPFYREKIEAKRQNTNIERYGKPYKQQTEQFQIAKKKTCLEKYGFEYASSSPTVKEKVRETIKNKYGYENCSQIPEVKEKVLKTRYLLNNFVCSKPQKQIWEWIGGLLNYPFKQFCFDIFLPDRGIIIEYNGSGHDLNVKRGKISAELFLKKEKFREKVIFENGYKLIYINSLKDKLPQKAELQRLINYSIMQLDKGKHKVIIDLDAENITTSSDIKKFQEII